MKFRKKPVVIEAMLFAGGAFTTAAENIAITTLEGTMAASIGDYIIKGVAGEFYPCKPEIFEQTYEPALTPEASK
ncbi:hypothetical protein D4765_18780 [Subtercola vilae]|uniref:Uncharacterized protein n=2 Tax=Subtercola vilae TaxID=2056433 RepID=A0A4T2B7P4_9MICO|nr:hypothetical protein D4765_18780 [Subtercola vilae]